MNGHMPSGLLHAASDSTRHLKPPSTWQEFQSFCADAFPLVQEKFSTGRQQGINYWASSGYGKNGDRQHGVDIFDHFSPTTMQCKRVEKFGVDDLMKELKALAGYQSPLCAHFIVTSLEETTRAVIDHVANHNRSLDIDAQAGLPAPSLPIIRLPQLYVLNWPEIKAILGTDYFLALKWGFHPVHPHYPNLNRINLSTLKGAANSMGSSLPPGGGGKNPRVLEAIYILTWPLDVDAIEALGESDKIASSTINGMWDFLTGVIQARDMGRKVNSTLADCESLDGVRRHEGLRTLDDIVIFLARIEAYKYLNRLAQMVKRLVRLLDQEHHFIFGTRDYEHEGMPYPDTDESIRYYNFTDIDSASPPWYLSRQYVQQSAQFIAQEIRKVRVNIAPPDGRS